MPYERLTPTAGEPAPATWRTQLPLYWQLVRGDRPVGTLLLLWPTLTALWIASSGRPSLGLLAVFIVGTFLMRSAGCAINDAADFRYDAQVKRTAQRVVGILHVVANVEAMRTVRNPFGFRVIIQFAEPVVGMIVQARSVADRGGEAHRRTRQCLAGEQREQCVRIRRPKPAGRGEPTDRSKTDI